MQIHMFKCNFSTINLLCQTMHRAVSVICMNRIFHFNCVSEKLHVLSYRLQTNGKLNLLDAHIHSEDFFSLFFNLIYGYELRNLNHENPNSESIDLIDEKNQILIQVSAKSTKEKIESSLDKDILKKYSSYTFKFISIAKDASNLKKITDYKNPYSINFNPKEDIYDIISILDVIRGKPNHEIKKIHEFIKDELGSEIDPSKLDSNLATIINILSKEKWHESDGNIDVNPFEIDRKISFNDLKNKSDLIHDNKIYHHIVEEKYTQFDSLGKNKSISVLSKIRRFYLNNKNKNDADTTFSLVIDEVIDEVLSSDNFQKIPLEELEMCVEILVVDAFIRCKIFKNPEGYCYATSRQY